MKWLRKKKVRTAVFCGILAALMFSAVNLPAAVGVASTNRQLPIYCVQRDQKMVSLSFDAAWGTVGARRHALDKPEQRLALQIIDAKNQIAKDRSIDSFIVGFRPVWRLSNKLNTYEKTRPMLTPREVVASKDAFIADEN